MLFNFLNFAETQLKSWNTHLKGSVKNSLLLDRQCAARIRKTQRLHFDATETHIVSQHCTVRSKITLSGALEAAIFE